MLRPDHGRILLFPSGSKLGTGDGETPRSLRGQIGFVSQALFLYEDLTVAENLRLFADCCNNDSGLRVLSEEVVRFQLSPFLERRVSECSQGIARRASIVRALLSKPELLLLDEPYSSLDQVGRTALDQVLSQYQSAGRTVLLASHDPEILARHTGPRLGLRGGEVAESTPRREQSQQALH
jgi:ABC-type multidrug transport system ATPase subunit